MTTDIIKKIDNDNYFTIHEDGSMGITGGKAEVVTVNKKEVIKMNNRQKDILLNLILNEFRHIQDQNANIQPLLAEYQNELHQVYKIICNSLDDEE